MCECDGAGEEVEQGYGDELEEGAVFGGVEVCVECGCGEGEG